MAKPKASPANEQEPEGDPQLEGEQFLQQAPPEPDPTDNEVDSPELESGQIDQIRKLLSDNKLMGGYVRVMRRAPGDMKFSFIDKIPLDEFDTDHIAKLYGGGLYNLAFYTAKGRLGARREFTVDPRIKGEIDKEAPAQPQNQGASVRETIALAKELAPAPVAPVAPDKTGELMMTLLVKSMEQTQAIMVAALTARPAAPVHTGLDLKDLLPLLIPMMTRAPDATGKVGSMTELIAAVKELKALSEPDNEPEGIMETIAKMAPSLLTAYAASRGTPSLPAAPVQQRLPAAPPPSPAGPDASPVGRTPGQIDIIVAAARRGSDPGLYADFVLDNTPEDQAEILKTVLTGEAWFGQLFGGYPDADKLRPWLEKLRTQILDALSDTGPDDGQPDKPGDEATGKPDPGRGDPPGV